MVRNFKIQGCMPLFFEDGNVNVENCRNMLINYVCPRLSSLRDNSIFYQDGAPALYSRRVRRYLNNKKPEKWIGRDSPVEWCNNHSHP